MLEAFSTELEKHGLHEKVMLSEVGCLGLCHAEVLVEIKGLDGRSVLYQKVDARSVPRIVKSHLIDGEPSSRKALAIMSDGPHNGLPTFAELPFVRHQVKIVLRNCGIIDPTNIDHYIARGGYSGLIRSLSIEPDEVIEEMVSSGLRGRGGAGFPTGRKWGLASEAAGEDKYVICNADEGDPGAFMDRSVLESDPQSVLEGMLIAGYAIGSRFGYVYCRDEYPLAIERLQTAIAQMREKRLLGEDILGSGFSFDIKIKRGAGAFVCGEETALMASVEGRRGMPMPKPPFPAVSGLFHKPTCINNVETLASVSAIMERGPDWYSTYGTEQSRGTKTFALTGKINNAGLIEVPMGISLRTIIEDIGGGIPDDRQFKAVQTGGPSGGCIPAELLDLPVDYEHLREAGSIMGSGGMVVMDEQSCMVDVSRYFVTFTENESCGKCVPCRMGTQHVLNILTEITEGRGNAAQIEQLNKIGDTMRRASLCGLGQTAPNPVLSTLRFFGDEYRAHVEEKKCPAGVCRSMVTFTINAETCTGCRACSMSCPVEGISGEKKTPHKIDQLVCIQCGSCRDVCHFDAVLVD